MERDLQQGIINILERYVGLLRALDINFHKSKTIRNMYRNDKNNLDNDLEGFSLVLENERLIKEIGYEKYLKRFEKKD